MSERSNRGRYSVEALIRNDQAQGMHRVGYAQSRDAAVSAALNAMFGTDIQVARIIDRNSKAMIFGLIWTPSRAQWRRRFAPAEIRLQGQAN